MSKNANFSHSANSKHSVETTLTPKGDAIEYRIHAKLVDKTSQEPVPHVNTLPADDAIWNLVFGGQRGTKRFLKGKKKVKKVLTLASLGLKDAEVKV